MMTQFLPSNILPFHIFVELLLSSIRTRLLTDLLTHLLSKLEKLAPSLSFYDTSE